MQVQDGLIRFNFCLTQEVPDDPGSDQPVEEAQATTTEDSVEQGGAESNTATTPQEVGLMKSVCYLFNFLVSFVSCWLELHWFVFLRPRFEGVQH